MAGQLAVSDPERITTRRRRTRSLRHRYNAYGPWLRQHFGRRVYKVSVDGGFTCPNRDGNVAWGGCTYCNNESFRPEGSGVQLSIEEQVRNGIDYLRGRFKADRFLIYWQNFSNTYAPVARLRDLYSTALNSDPHIIGMSIGTRPDCVEEEKLNMIQEVAGNRYVCMEYGLESIYDETLARLNRGHDLACYLDAVERTRKRQIPVCSHIILGLPGESREMMMEYTQLINSLGIQFLKIHHLHIVRGTRMALDFRQAPFPTFAFEEWIELVCDFLERLDPSIVVQRLFGWAPAEHLIAPRWNRTKAEILLEIERELEKRDSRQGKLLHNNQFRSLSGASSASLIEAVG